MKQNNDYRNNFYFVLIEQNAKNTIFSEHNRHYVFQMNSLYSELCRSLVFVNVDTKAKKYDTRNREDLIDYAHYIFLDILLYIRLFRRALYQRSLLYSRWKNKCRKRSESISKKHCLLSIFELFPICTLCLRATQRRKIRKFRDSFISETGRNSAAIFQIPIQACFDSGFFFDFE